MTTPFSFDSVLTNSPNLYKPSHKKLQQLVRAFVLNEIEPHIEAWETAGEIPRELHRKAYEAGFYNLGLPEKYGGCMSFDGDRFDAFHTLVILQELARVGSGGLGSSFMGSMMIGMPPILAMGSEELKARVCPAIIRGEKIICLCISEPFAGSDVAAMRTTATTVCDAQDKDDCYYVLNGEKMFITSGMRADYFTVAARTPTKGITLFLVERSFPGVQCRVMDKKMGWWCGDTALVVLDGVRVPKRNMIGSEGNGFRAIMLNFNNERLAMAAQSTCYARVCLEEAIAYARQRKTFGKPLIANQVIRHKIVDMAAKVEICQTYVERLYSKILLMNKNDNNNNNNNIFSAEICMAKLQAGLAMEFCAREACQIFGGRAFLRGGRASKVERIYREARVMAIGGGSEEIMRDLAAKQAKL
eukprot:PhM_4_TR10167/c0_g1_i1/m.55498